MMIQPFLLVLVFPQLVWTQKDTSLQTDMVGLSASAPPDLTKVNDSSSNDDEEPGDEAYDDHKDLGRKLKLRKSNKAKDKGRPTKSSKRDGFNGDLNKQKSGNGHKRKNKKKIGDQKKNNQKARKSKPRTKVKKQHLKNKMPIESHGDADPVIGARAAALPLPPTAPLAEHAAAPPPTRHSDLSQNTKEQPSRSHEEKPTAHQPVIGARAAALPSQSYHGADYSQNKTTPQHLPTPPFLHNSYQRTDDSSHVGAYKAHHDNLGGAYNTHGSSNRELASSLSKLSTSLSEFSTKMEGRLTALQNILKDRQDSLRQVSSLVTMMVYGSGYPSYPYGFGRARRDVD